jgi:hypothetical protein
VDACPKCPNFPEGASPREDSNGAFGFAAPGRFSESSSQLRRYTDLRIAFYRTRDEQELQQINNDTSNLQNEMWSAIETPALTKPTR